MTMQYAILIISESLVSTESYGKKKSKTVFCSNTLLANIM